MRNGANQKSGSMADSFWSQKAVTVPCQQLNCNEMVMEF